MDSTTVNQTKRTEKFARIGIGAKGVVYCLAGILTILAVFNIIGDKAGEELTLEYIARQPLGKLILFLMGLGLIGHVFWRVYQTFRRTEYLGLTASSTWNKINYLLSGLTYAVIAYTIFKLTFTGQFGFAQNGNQQLINQVLAYSWGKWLIGLGSLGFFGKALWQFHRAFSGNYINEMKRYEFSKMVRETVRNAGFVGYMARGFVIGLIGYFFLRAAIEANPAMGASSSGAFQFLEMNPLGPFLLTTVSIGLICYGLYMFVKAKYNDLTA